MAWRGAASRSLLAAVRRPSPAATATFAARLRPPPPAARRRIPFASPITTARPLASMMGIPAAAVAARLTAHPAASARACCELSQGTFRRTCQDR